MDSHQPHRHSVPSSQKARPVASGATRKQATRPAQPVSPVAPFVSWLFFGFLTLSLGGLTFFLTEPSLLAQGAPSANAPDLSPEPILDLGKIALTMGVVLALVLLHAFLATAEIALITLRKPRLRQLVEERNGNAILVERLLAQPTRLMATIQTSIILVGMFAAGIAAISVVPPVKDWIRAHSTGMVADGSSILALALVMLPVAALSLIVGGIAPRSLAMIHSERLALLAAKPILALQFLLAPAVLLVMLLSNLMLRPFGGTASFLSPAVNEEELKMMVEASEEQGVLEAEETEMIQSILTFSDTVVRKVMTPRIDMTGIEVDTTLAEILALIHASGHSRIPVYEGELDNIVGIVHAKDLLLLPPETPRDSCPLRQVMRPPYFIPETKKIAELLSELRRNKQQLCIVRDEYGTTSGLATIEDILEEIVGDIQDEYDQEEPMIEVINASATRFDGKTPLDDVNERMGLELPEDEADTIGGFVFNLLGHQAEPGERATWGSVEFVAEATDGRRITKVRLEVRPHDESPTLDESHYANVLESVHHLAIANEMRPPLEISGVETAPRLPARNG